LALSWLSFAFLLAFSLLSLLSLPQNSKFCKYQNITQVELYGNAIDDSGRFLNGTESSREYAESWEAQHHRQGHPHQHQQQELEMQEHQYQQEQQYQQYQQQQEQQYQQYQEEQQQQQRQQQQRQQRHQYHPYVPYPTPSAPDLADMYSYSSDVSHLHSAQSSGGVGDNGMAYSSVHSHSAQSSHLHSVQSSLGYGKNGRALSDSHYFAEAEEGEECREEMVEENEGREGEEEEKESTEEEEEDDLGHEMGMQGEDGYRAPGLWASEKERIEAMEGPWAGANRTGQVRAEEAGHVAEQDRDVYEFERRMCEHFPEDAGDVYQFGEALAGEFICIHQNTHTHTHTCRRLRAHANGP
jgi:type II secretory pathway pseudopilin PulG